MKSKLIALGLIVLGLNANAQFFYQKIAKATFKENSKKAAIFKTGTTIVNITKGMVNANLNGKTALLTTTPINTDVQVTAYDLTGDKKPEILVAYFDIEAAQAKLLAFDGATLKLIDKIDGGSYYEFSKNSVAACIPHSEVVEKHIYYLKKGKLVLDKKNSIY